ncbi:hypothetical protein BY458DRAFT_509756 [Sporodiniella umbellata]|nr:hypothetical protein BY458DRAFT_509756 [Sporodiniella umbellata]
MSAAFYSFINSVTNPITSKYEIKSQISTSGLWKIYRGQRKTSGKEVALFVKQLRHFLFLHRMLNWFIDFRKKDNRQRWV